jgi:hypothetical protein
MATKVYSVQGPDGRIYDVEGPEGASDQQVIAALMQHLQSQPKPQSGFTAGAKAGLENLKSDFYSGLAGIGVEGAAEKSQQYRRKAAQMFQMPEFTEHPIDYVTSLLGQSVPYMAAPLAAGVAASPLGALASMGAAGAASAAQFTGSNLSRQLEEGVRPEALELGKAATAAVPQAALDVIGLRYIPGIRNLLGRAGMQVGEQEAKGIVNKYIVPAFKTAGVEGGTEAAQQVFERLQAGLAINDAEARKEYFDNFLGGAVLGGAISIPGTMLEGARRAPAEPTPLEVVAPEAETETAPTAEAQPALPAPEKVPALGYTPTTTSPAPAAQPPKEDVYKLMDHHDTLKSSLDPLADQIEAARKAGDNEKASTLIQEYRDNEAAMNALQTKITELGGITQSGEEVDSDYAKTTKSLDAKIAKLQNTVVEMSRADVRDYDAVDKAEKQIAKLQEQRAAADAAYRQKQEVLKVKETPKGETIPLFAAEEQQPKATEVLKFETPEGQKTAAEIEQATQGPQRPDQETISAAAKKAVAQRENVLAKRQEELNAVLQRDTRPMDAYARENHEEQKHQALMQVRQLENEIGALKEGAPTKALAEKKEGKFGSDELYGDFNILNTAINNNDEKTLNRIREMRRKADLDAFNALHSKLTPREEVYELLKDRIGGILRREKNYDTYEATINKKRVELSVSEEAAKKIKRLRNIVEAPRERIVNGKKVPVRSLLQQLHDAWDDYNARVEQLTALKKAKAEPEKLAKKKEQVEKAKAKYQKKFNEVAAYRQQLDAELAKLYKIEGEFAPAPGTKGEPTIKTPRQKQEELEKLGRSKRELSRPAKTAVQAQAGKVKVSEAQIAQELGEKTDAYQAFAAPYQKRLQAKADQYNKFVATANERLAKLKEKYIDTKEVAAVEKQVADAKAALNAVPKEDLLEKEKAQKKVTGLEEHLRVVETPKEDKYKIAEANLVKMAKERLDALNQLRDELTAAVNAKAVEIGRALPEFKAAVAEAQKTYTETVAAGKQEVKSLRTKQETRKVGQLPFKTGSEEALARAAKRQAEFEAGLSEAKGEAYDYQQRQEAIERTRKAREAKAGTGSAMKAAMTEAANKKMQREVEGALAKEEGKFARGVEVESPDLSTEQIRLIEDNNVVGVLRSIANDPKASEINRAVAQRLAVMLDNTSIEIQDRLYAPDGKEVLGEAVSTNIKLSRNGGLSQEVLLHEGTHSAVERVIQMPDSMLTQEQVIAKRELNAMFKAIQKDPSITSSNAKSSLSEFAAEIFSNKNLQEQLRKKPWKGSTLWEGIKSVILRLLGVKVPQNMLGNALKAVDVMLIPSSSKIGRVEKPVNRKYSTKDIAALHTGSNSMRQFAEQFGPEIKQKDRTVEDVDRLATGYLVSMEISPEDYVAKVDPAKLDYKAMATMSDGQRYDPNNPLHFVEAEPMQLAASMALGNPNFATKEAAELTKERKKALADLAKYLLDSPDYTRAEMALVAKAASKYGVMAGKDGRLKVVNISDNNRHPVAVVGHESAKAVVEELRKGKSLKDAFIDGLQSIADRNAKENLGKNGWQKFNQVEDDTAGLFDGLYTDEELLAAMNQVEYDRDMFATEEEYVEQLIEDGLLPRRRRQSRLQDAAVELNAAAAGTPWCTGAGLSHARSHIEGGDFYIYYENGKPQVAVRMDGKDKVHEVRGNSPSQGLNAEQRAIAKQFLQEKKFSRSENFTDELARREIFSDLLSGKRDLTVPELNLLSGGWDLFDSTGVRDNAVKRALVFGTTLGYSAPKPSEHVIDVFKNLIAKQIADKYAQGYWFATSSPYISYRDTGDTVTEVEVLGKTYKLPINKIKALSDVTLNSRNDLFKSLEYVGRVGVFGGYNKLPKIKDIKELTIYGAEGEISTLDLPDGAHIENVRPAGNARVSVDILGKVKIDSATLLRDTATLDVNAPNAEYVIAESPNLNKLADNIAETYSVIMRRKMREQSIDTGIMHAEGYDTGSGIVPTEAEASHIVSDMYKRLSRVFGKDNVMAVINNTPKDKKRSVYSAFNYVVETLVKNQGNNASVYTLAEKMFDSVKGFTKEEIRYNPFPVGEGSVSAPNVIRPGEQVFTHEQERPQYAPKDVGVQEEKPGVFSFKSYVQPGAASSSIVADDPKNIDYLKANFLGLAGRVQMVDKFAAISEAFKKGLEAKKINALEASNGEYYLRFGEQRSQYAQQALTNGPMQLKVTRETKDGKEYIYKSDAGANLMRVFEILQKSGIKNSVELDRMFTTYLAGKRAEQVGWEKLWVGNPAKAKAEHATVMQQLKSNPEMKQAFEDAAKEYKAFNNGLLDFLVQTGAITAEKAAELKAIDYVPYYRVNKGSGDVELFTDKEMPIRIGNIKDEPQLQELVGDNTQILPLSVSAVQNAFMLTDMALRNQRVKDTSFLLHKIGIAKTLGEGTGPASRDTIHFKVKGKPYYAIIDTDLYGIPADLIVKGMEGIKTTLPFAVKAMGVPADLLRKFVTRNPAYAVKQAIRDPLTAWMTTGTDGVPILNSFKELSSMVAGRSDAERKLMEAGAISSNVFTGDKGDMQRFLRDISAGKSGWEKLLAKADAFALQGDAATRAVIYKDSIAKGMSEQQALLRTLESMNFGRRGLSPTMHFLNTMIPFFNAQVQGLDVLYRAFTGNMPYSEQLEIRKKLVARGLMLAAGTLAYAAMMQDDEAYKRAKPEERLGNWFVYIPGTDEPFKVPIPFELGYLFKSLPEAVFNMAADDERSSDITKGMGKLVALSNPLGMPQAVKPVVELYLGKSFFGGDIESQREQKTMLPTERMRGSTTEVAKLLGSITGDAGITPIGWDHLTRGYTGGLGVALVSLANPILNMEASAAEKPSKKMHETPFIGGLFQPVEGRGTLDAAYERMLEIQQAKGTFERLLMEGKREEAKEFLEQYRNKIAASSVSGAVQQQLGTLAAARRQVISMPNMSQEKKDELLKRIDDAQYKMSRRFLDVTGETTPPASQP